MWFVLVLFMDVELYLLLTVLLGAGMLLVALRCFGSAGLQCYIGVGVIVANIQVLTAAEVIGYPFPIPQGTAVFSTLFLANNLLSEFFGRTEAKRGVWIGFFAYCLFTIFMQITIYTPVPAAADHFASAHQAIVRLFTPSVALLFASVVAYLLSQYADLLIYTTLRIRHGEQLFWLRGIVANCISALVDNIIFTCLLLLLVFDVQALGWSQLFWQYVVGSYVLRVLVSLISVPVLYFAKALARSTHFAYTGKVN